MEQTLRTRKFTCYFCNKTIENDTEMGHTAVCSNVLVPCTNKCGSYIARKDVTKHSRECLNRVTKSMNRLPVVNEDSVSMPNTSSLERYASTNGLYRGNENDETINIKKELYKLSKNLSDFERSYKNNCNNPTISNYLESLKNGQNQQKLELEKIKYQNKLIEEWKKNLELQLNNLKQVFNSFQKTKSETDIHWMNLQEKIMIIDKLQIDLNVLNGILYKESSYSRQISSDLTQNLDNFKLGYQDDCAEIRSIMRYQDDEMQNIKKELIEVRKSLEEQKAKHASIIFDVRTISQISSEACEKLEIQEREFASMKKDVSQMKMDLEMLDDLLSSQQNNAVTGKLLWKITDVKSKMHAAKESQSILKSPIFYTHDYGYKIRVIVHLNGLKKWKDRYVLICINVLKGEYDMTLKWPCNIEGYVSLKDLEHVEDPRPFSKRIVTKCHAGDEETEEPQESSSTYIFIPHSTLLKEMHLKENTIFLEINIDRQKALQTTL